MRLQPLSNFFPLYTYAEPSARSDQALSSQEHPSTPELWADVHDALSMYWITRLQLHQVPHSVKHMHTPDSAPDGQLPALLCPNGDLLAAHQLPSWFEKQLELQGVNAASNQIQDDDRAWCTLFEQKLMPAYLATLYSEPVFSHWSATRRADRPALSQMMSKLLASRDQHNQLTHLRDLLHCTSVSDAVILEDLDAEARRALDAATAQLSNSQTQWLLNSQHPTRADAWLAAYLTLFSNLGDIPSTETSKPFLYTYIHRSAVKPLLEWHRDLNLTTPGQPQPSQ